MWLARKKGAFDGDWQAYDISGPRGIKYDRMELLDIDEDGDLDVLACEERESGKGLGLFWYENPTQEMTAKIIGPENISKLCKL